ncbi:hypothetical protein JF66_15425 [Cryobacterium sp. MLB-32]|uniref:type II secretion system F family protein n=1 Tax=Cryobacterium sp. MLB-32 TaxID=1529318 RepID=UPI0004E70C0A|nr:type II secretion system F family protein [Cryobacterium sp. MLB-32]KFF58860.1 hypothetical protein JF66_15425 [Cryobacterium sp. MLB-32]
MSSRTGSDSAPLDDVAALTERLAVLLSAGVSPVSAWGYLLPDPVLPLPPGHTGARDGHGLRGSAAEPPAWGIIRAAAEAGRRGRSIADAVAERARHLGGQTGAAWLGLAAAWDVATESGAPLAACLRDLAATFRHLGQLHRDLQVALAGPRATARLVMALPVGGLLVGALMGFDALHMLFLTVPGWMCLAAAGALLWVAHRWSGRLVRQAGMTDAAPGLLLDLTAVAMAGGGSVNRARAVVEQAAEKFGIRSGDGEGSEPLHAVLRLAERAGVPAAELLRSEARQVRRDARSAGQRRAEALAVTLMLPLGVCVLPAFMLVGVLPLLLSILSTTLRSF